MQKFQGYKADYTPYHWLAYGGESVASSGPSGGKLRKTTGIRIILPDIGPVSAVSTSDRAKEVRSDVD